LGALPPSPAKGCLQVLDALPGPLLATSSKVAITVGLKKASWVFHRLFTACGEDRTRVKIGLVPTTGRPDGIPKGAVRVAGDRQSGLGVSPMPAGPEGVGVSPHRDRPVSPMEGTSGAADPAPLRGGVSDAALGLGCVVPACPCASVVRPRVAFAGWLVQACRVRARRLLPFAGVGFAWWDREGVALPRDAGSGSHPGTGSRRFGGNPPVTSGSVGVSSRHCSGLTTRGVRADRVGVAASPGRP